VASIGGWSFAIGARMLFHIGLGEDVLDKVSKDVGTEGADKGLVRRIDDLYVPVGGLQESLDASVDVVRMRIAFHLVMVDCWKRTILLGTFFLSVKQTKKGY